MITAPFNFVPLSEKVFFPDWSEKVSHDVPFEDAQSGVIDVTITAKSPLFIRDHENDEAFCQHDGTYYIPGSSVKGMVRNVLEIMSFSKIPIDTKIHDKVMSVRDMSNRNELVGTANGCGFLKKDADGKWIIVDYGKPRTIEYSNQSNKFIQYATKTIDCDFDTAKDKYEKNGLYQRVAVHLDIKDLMDRNKRKIGTKKVASISGSENNAYLVLTGGIDNKKNEFIFADSDRGNNINNIEKVVEKFKNVYFESDSIDGKFWKQNFNPDIGIPIFYKKQNNNITDIGLSQLFKLAYDHTVNDATKQIIQTITKEDKKYPRLDLAETIFGTIQEELKEDKKSSKDIYALKGRVQFSHFKVDSKPQEYETITTVLGSPNPSFYPEYIQQNCKDDGKVENDRYNTLMNPAAKIAGWKRYPLRYGRPSFKKADEGTDSATSFTPIGAYTGNVFNEFTFSGKVRFHNLKKVEVGALISALTFHDQQEEFYHNIGMAKSLGFGKIAITVDTKPYINHQQEYEMMISSWTKENLQKEWIKTEQIKELFTMAYRELNIDNKLKYLVLDPDNRINEFTDAKNEKVNREYVGRDCLPKTSQLFDLGDNYPRSFLTEELLAEIEIRKSRQKEEAIRNKNLKEAMTTDNTQIIQNFIDKYPAHEKIEELVERKKTIEDIKISDKHAEVNKKAKAAWESLEKKKSNKKQYDKEKDKFLKKWKAEKNNKGSEYILELVKKLDN